MFARLFAIWFFLGCGEREAQCNGETMRMRGRKPHKELTVYENNL